MSEYGFQSFPELKTIRSFARWDDLALESPVMLSHQKNPRGNQLIREYMLRDYEQPKDFASFLYVSQVLQAEGIKVGAEALRRARPRTMGSLYWQLDDCWPVASWSSIDYFGRWKALHYYARRFYADRARQHLGGGRSAGREPRLGSDGGAERGARRPPARPLGCRLVGGAQAGRGRAARQPEGDQHRARDAAGRSRSQGGVPAGRATGRRKADGLQPAFLRPAQAAGAPEAADHGRGHAVGRPRPDPPLLRHARPSRAPGVRRRRRFLRRQLLRPPAGHTRRGGSGTILHWDGTGWSGVPSGTTSDLSAVWGSGASDVWVVGSSGATLHWNGTAWSNVQSGSSAALYGVWGSGTTDVWAVGAGATTLRWDGTAWSKVAIATTCYAGTFKAVWGSGATDVWTVGMGSIFHWDGTAWSSVTTGLPQCGMWSNNLYGVWGNGPSDVWVVGEYGFIVRWNGTAWSFASSSGSANPDFYGVWGSGPDDVWAVGTGDGTALTIRWGGDRVVDRERRGEELLQGNLGSGQRRPGAGAGEFVTGQMRWNGSVWTYATGGAGNDIWEAGRAMSGPSAGTTPPTGRSRDGTASDGRP